MSFDEYEYKCCVAGAPGCGKTSFLEMMYRGKLCHNYNPTIGADMIPYRTTYENQKTILRFWDTGGQERYRALVKMFYRNCQFCIFFYNINDKRTFQVLQEWVPIVRDEASPILQGMVVGTHDDKVREVPQSMGMEFAESHGFTYAECCTFDLVSVHSVLSQILKQVVGNCTPKQKQYSVEIDAHTTRECCLIT